MKTKSVELELLTVLKDLVADLAILANQFMVSANYFDHLTEGREGERWYIAQIWLSQQSAENVTLTDEGLVCDVHLNRQNYSDVSRILLPFDQIWSVQRLTDSVDHQPIVYYQGDKLNLCQPDDDE